MDAKKVLPVVATLVAGAVAVHYVVKKKQTEGNEEINELPEGHKDLDGLETIVSPPEEETETSLPAVTTETAK